MFIAEGDHAVVEAFDAVEVGGGHLAGVEASDGFGGAVFGGRLVGHFAFAAAGRGEISFGVEGVVGGGRIEGVVGGGGS